MNLLFILLYKLPQRLGDRSLVGGVLFSLCPKPILRGTVGDGLYLLIRVILASTPSIDRISPLDGIRDNGANILTTVERCAP